MKIQIRNIDGSIMNPEGNITGLGICVLLADRTTEKISFDLDECRIALRPDGTYQIFGGVVNYPAL